MSTKEQWTCRAYYHKDNKTGVKEITYKTPKEKLITRQKLKTENANLKI